MSGARHVLSCSRGGSELLMLLLALGIGVAPSSCHPRSAQPLAKLLAMPRAGFSQSCPLYHGPV